MGVTLNREFRSLLVNATHSTVPLNRRTSKRDAMLIATYNVTASRALRSVAWLEEAAPTSPVFRILKAPTRVPEAGRSEPSAMRNLAWAKKLECVAILRGAPSDGNPPGLARRSRRHDSRYSKRRSTHGRRSSISRTHPRRGRIRLQAALVSPLRRIRSLLARAAVVSRRLQRHATDLDVYAPEDGSMTRSPAGGAGCYRRLVAQGWTDALRACTRMDNLHVLEYFRTPSLVRRLRIDHLLSSPMATASHEPAWTVTARATRRAIMHPLIELAEPEKHRRAGATSENGEQGRRPAARMVSGEEHPTFFRRQQDSINGSGYERRWL